MENSADYSALMTTFPLFEGHTVHGTRSLIERGQLRECVPGEVLYRQGDTASRVVLVLTGSVEHFVTRQSRDVRLGVAGPSQVLADVQVVSRAEHPASARATDATVLLEWDADAFRRLIASDIVPLQRAMLQTAQALAAQAETLIAGMTAIREVGDSTS